MCQSEEVGKSEVDSRTGGKPVECLSVEEEERLRRASWEKVVQASKEMDAFEKAHGIGRYHPANRKADQEESAD